MTLTVHGLFVIKKKEVELVYALLHAYACTFAHLRATVLHRQSKCQQQRVNEILSLTLLSVSVE